MMKQRSEGEIEFVLHMVEQLLKGQEKLSSLISIMVLTGQLPDVLWFHQQSGGLLHRERCSRNAVPCDCFVLRL